ncbi:hypothetical protein A2U01_0072394, partial [Trifolium medium]|nr:hypothetical protein [Trifolium medium]
MTAEATDDATFFVSICGCRAPLDTRLTRLVTLHRRHHHRSFVKRVSTVSL